MNNGKLNIGRVDQVSLGLPERMRDFAGLYIRVSGSLYQSSWISAWKNTNSGVRIVLPSLVPGTQFGRYSSILAEDRFCGAWPEIMTMLTCLLLPLDGCTLPQVQFLILWHSPNLPITHRAADMLEIQDQLFIVQQSFILWWRGSVSPGLGVSFFLLGFGVFHYFA